MYTISGGDFGFSLFRGERNQEGEKTTRRDSENNKLKTETKIKVEWIVFLFSF